MMKEPVLVVMAAGMGSRYGGLKQIDPVGSQGEAILDYSLYDAYQAGFRTAVIIIKEAIKNDFMETVGKRLENCPMEIRYAYQELHMLPNGYNVPYGRSKPWGTTHAVYCAREAIGGAPFVCLNADDYYGKEAFKVAYNDSSILIKCRAPHPEKAAVSVPRDSTKLWQNPVWEIFLSDANFNRRQMVFSSAPGSAYDAAFYKKDPYVRWNGNWSHTDTVKNGVWESCVTIPFKSVFGRLPREGENLLMQFCHSPAGAPFHYAFNVPLSGAFNDATGFAKVRFGEPSKPGTVRTINLNGDFKVKDKKGFPAGWLFIPKRPGSVESVKGNTVSLSKKVKAYQGFYSLDIIQIDPDEECVFSAVISGKGRVNLGAGWHRGDRVFAANQSDKMVTLTEKPQLLTWRFKCGVREMQLGAWGFQPVIFLHGTDSQMTIEKIELKVIRR